MIPAAYKGAIHWRAAVHQDADRHGSLLMTAHIFDTEQDALEFAQAWIDSGEISRDLLALFGEHGRHDARVDAFDFWRVGVQEGLRRAGAPARNRDLAVQQIAETLYCQLVHPDTTPAPGSTNVTPEQRLNAARTIADMLEEYGRGDCA